MSGRIALVLANDVLQDQRAIEARISEQRFLLVVFRFAEALESETQIEHARGRAAGADQ